MEEKRKTKREREKKRREATPIKDATSKNQIKKCAVDDLRTFLNQRLLDSTGNKSELVDRIWGYLEKKRKNKEVNQRVKEVIKKGEFQQNCSQDNYHPITGQDLYSGVHQFEDKDVSDFTVEDFIQVINTLSHVTYIDMRNASPEALQTRDKFYYRWQDFVETHPDLKKVLDPWYVLFDFGALGGLVTAAGPPGWGAAVAALGGIGLGGLGIGSVHPVPAGPPGEPIQSQYLFQVGGAPGRQQLAARHLGGFMQGRFPGLHFHEFSLAVPPMYY